LSGLEESRLDECVMMKHHKGYARGGRWKFAIVVATFNEEVTGRLLMACLNELNREGIAEKAVEVVRVPGAFELPLVARTLASTNQFDAVICLGAVIRGDTSHFEYICAEVTRGIGQAALETGIPVIFGVLTTENEDQAQERADPKQFNRGGSAAQTALTMARVMRRLREGQGGSRLSKPDRKQMRRVR